MKRPLRPRVNLACIALVAAGLFTACGVGVESSAHVFRDDEVPSGIIDRSFAPTTSVSGTTTTIAPLANYRLFFIRAGALFEVSRTLAGVPSLMTVIDSLSQGPSSFEISTGYRSALAASSVVSVRVNGFVAQVDLARSFADIRGLDQTLAIGQITLTLTDRADVSRVQFTMANVSIDVPKGNGSLTHEPVAADDFRELVRLPSGPSTTLSASGPSGASGGTGSSGASGASGALHATGSTGSTGQTGSTGSTGSR